MKKRKLNSNNPKYQKHIEEEKVEKKLMCTANGCEVYFVYKK